MDRYEDTTLKGDIAVIRISGENFSSAWSLLINKILHLSDWIIGYINFKKIFTLKKTELQKIIAALKIFRTKNFEKMLTINNKKFILVSSLSKVNYAPFKVI